MLKTICLTIVISSFGFKTYSQNADQNAGFRIQLIAILVEDLQRSMDWYINNLGFEIESDKKEYPDYGLSIAMLRLGDLHLEMIQNWNAIPVSELNILKGSVMNGFGKIGFVVNDIETIQARLVEMEDVEMVVGLSDLPKPGFDQRWPDKYFLIKDPDGNWIQFFSFPGKNSETAIEPWMTMITVRNIDSVSTWYQENLQFELYGLVGTKGNRRAIMGRNRVIIELFEPEKVILFEEMESKTEFHGFKKLAFGIRKFQQQYDRFMGNNVDIIIAPEKSDFSWAEQATIAKDLEGNWIQIFELTN